MVVEVDTAVYWKAFVKTGSYVSRLVVNLLVPFTLLFPNCKMCETRHECREKVMVIASKTRHLFCKHLHFEPLTIPTRKDMDTRRF